jgi:hypothetical protein
MRDNEPLGIYEELRERAERYAEQGEATRRRIMGAGPAPNGAYAQLVNPFQVRLRLKNGGKPYHRYRAPPSSARAARRRAIWPEAVLGLNIVQVVQAVILESGLSAADLMTESRTKRVAWPRHVTMWAIDRYCPDYSLPEIAYVFRKDHTTVLHGIEATNVRLANDCPTTKPLVANVRRRLLHAAQGGD